MGLAAVFLTLLAASACTWTQNVDGLFCENNCHGGDAGADAASAGKGKLYVLAANVLNDIKANRIRLELRVVNNTNADVALSDLALRYYFTIDTGTNPEFQCNFTPSMAPPYDCKNLVATVPVLAASTPTADHAFQITFGASAGLLRAFGGDSGVMKVSLSSGGEDFDQSNDYSFRPGNVEPALSETITITRAGKLVWGQAP